MPLLRPDFTRHAYHDLLRLFYGYYRPLEQRLLEAGHWREMGLDFPQRLKVPALEKDLAKLGDSEAAMAAIPRCGILPAVGSLAESMGCFYVLEGATLGGQIISKHLLENLRLTPECGCAFFSGYAAETGPRWKAFGEVFTAAAKPGEEDAIIASANRTFSTLADWLFGEGESSPPHES